MALCQKCGNEVLDPTRCPVCKAGAAPKAPKASTNRCACPRCDDPRGPEAWEGTITLVCPTCRGTFFPDRGLEAALDRLRATCDPGDIDSVMRDFKDRFTRELPANVRYRACPVCSTVMTRRNYATVSGVIVDHCGDHGTWVDETAFAGLADFICRGGDLVATEAQRVRARGRPKTTKQGRTLLDKFFGTG